MGTVTTPQVTTKWLLCRAGPRACGLPLETVLLTLRRPALESWAGSHTVADGVATVRGEVVPVVSLSRILSGQARDGEKRLVVLSVAGRKVGLGVSAVLGIRSFSEAATSELPPLLADERADHVSRLGLLDGELLVLLRTGRLVPDEAASDAAANEGHA